MSLQTTYLWWCIVTSVAFVWLFSTVRFIMSPQNACLRRGIFTLLAFVWFFSTVRFYMCPQNVCLSRGIVGRIGCICLTSLHCVFSNVSSNGLHEKMHSHIGCICLIYQRFQLFSSGILHPLKVKSLFPICLITTLFCALLKWLLQTELNLKLSFGPKVFHDILSLFTFPWWWWQHPW